MGKKSRMKKERRGAGIDDVPELVRGNTKSLYKYVGPESVDKVFRSPGFVTLKCGYPSEFNDPYELFLTMDFTAKPELIAFYGDVVGEIPQLPTTCFSRSPAVLPMWAHYASNLQGFVLEIDEQSLSKIFPRSGFGDVDYQDGPSAAVEENLYRAYEIGKFRYMHFLRRSVFSAAYYTKQSCWAYESERRMIVDETEVRKLNELTLLDVPTSCVKSIICGPRAKDHLVNQLQKEADTNNCAFFQMRIGKSTGLPYFDSPSGQKFAFYDENLSPVANTCRACSEPIKADRTHCSWCLIDDSHRQNAAQKNSFRLLDHYGILGSYMEGMQAIESGNRR